MLLLPVIFKHATNFYLIKEAYQYEKQFLGF